MSKYTKGRWLFKSDGDRTIVADGKSIMCDTSYYPWCPDADADWHLIAAAPELLEALKAAKKYVAFAYSEGIDGAEEAGLKLDAAIAKAEGEQQ